jgi:WD40 repeat protein
VTSSPALQDRFREQSYQQQIVRLEADHQQRVSQLKWELDQVRRSAASQIDLLLIERVLAGVDREQARGILDLGPGSSRWEWDYLNGHLQGKNLVFEFRAQLPILCMVFNDEYLVAGGGKESADDPRDEKGEISVWDIKTRERLWHWELDTPVRSVSFTNLGLALVSSSQHRGPAGCLQVRSLRTHGPRFPGNLVFPPYQFKSSKPSFVIEAPFIPQLLVTTDEGTLHQVQGDNGQLSRTKKVEFRQPSPSGLHGRLRQIESNRFALIRPDGNQILLLTDLHGDNPPIELPDGAGTTFLDLAYSYQRKLLAAATLDGTILAWNMESPEREAIILRGHKGPVRGVSFNIDGQRLASCGQDGTVRIWDVGATRELLTLKGYHAASSVILESDLNSPRMPDRQERERQSAGRLAIAHGNTVTVILPPPRPGWMVDK